MFFSRLAVVLTIIAFLTVATAAAPVITGASGLYEEGSEVAISGSLFGSNNLDIQFLGGHDGLIETGALNQTPANTNGWLFDQGVGCNMKISDSHAHSGQKSLYCPQDSLNAAVRYRHPRNIGPNQRVFVSWWVRRNHTGSGQWKIFRFKQENDIQDGAPETVMSRHATSAPFFVRIDFAPSDPISWNMPYPNDDNRWYRIDVEVHTSSANESDGFYKVSRHDPTSLEPIASNSLIGMTFKNSLLYYKMFIWQNYIGNGIESQNIWMDDLFVQVGSVARVELGDSATWNTSTFREIQRPTKWSDSSIKLNFNQGSFKSGDNAFLYVVDADGIPSAAYPIIIGTAGPPSNVPSDLSPNQEPNAADSPDGQKLASSAFNLLPSIAVFVLLSLSSLK
jgi:hypothetical protein